MFPYDCGTIPHSFEQNESSLKHNLTSSTRPIWVRRLGKLPGVFKHVWKYNNVEWVWAAQRSSWPKKMQHIELKAKLQNISGNAVVLQLFSLAFINQREISVYSLWSCMPVLHSQQTMLWRYVLQRNAIFLTKRPLQPKSCCYLQAGGCFELVKCFFFRKKYFCEGRISFKNNMCYLRCVLRSKVQYWCLSFIK